MGPKKTVDKLTQQKLSVDLKSNTPTVGVVSPSSISPTPCVVNIRQCKSPDDYDVYCGRPKPGLKIHGHAVKGAQQGAWGNPYPLKPEATEADRQECIQKYRQWLMSNPDKIKQARAELRGKRLACWCKPKACHADVLLELSNSDPAVDKQPVQAGERSPLSGAEEEEDADDDVDEPTEITYSSDADTVGVISSMLKTFEPHQQQRYVLTLDLLVNEEFHNTTDYNDMTAGLREFIEQKLAEPLAVTVGGTTQLIQWQQSEVGSGLDMMSTEAIPREFALQTAYVLEPMVRQYVAEFLGVKAQVHPGSMVKQFVMKQPEDVRCEFTIMEVVKMIVL